MSYAPIPMVPGPVALHEDVIAVLGRDYGSGQVESDFLCLYDATSRGIGKLMGTKDDVVLMTGEGMLALWGALKSCLKPGDPVVSVGTGVFGDGIGEMAESFGCIVEKVSLPYDCSIRESDLAAVEEAIRRVKPVMLTAVHCETPSGTLNPIGLLGKLKKDLGVPLFYVDTVAGLGGAPVATTPSCPSAPCARTDAAPTPRTGTGWPRCTRGRRPSSRKAWTPRLPATKP